MADHNGTISQTLPSVTQAATGETDFFSARSTATLSEVVAFSYTNAEIATVQITESTLYGEVRSVSSVVQIAGSVFYASLAAESSSVTVDESLEFEWTNNARSSLGYVKSRATYDVSLFATGAVQIVSSVTYDVTTTAVEAATITSSTSSSATFTETVQETVLSTSKAYGGQSELVVERLAADSNTASTTELNGAESSSATVDDRDTAFVETFEELRAEIVVSERTSSLGSIYNNDVTDTAVVDDRDWARDFDALAWVLNPETGGVSQYDNFGYESVVAHNGVLYAASPEGIFALDNDTDEGRKIQATIQTGFLDFRREEMKRLSDFYLAYTGGEMALSVETYDGPQEVYTYNIEEREANAPRNNRIRIGKGLSSRYWRFTIENVLGADFQIYDMRAIVGTSNRRL